MKDFPQMFSHDGKSVKLIGKKRINTYKKLYEYIEELQDKNIVKTHENYLDDNELAQIFIQKNTT